MKGTDDPPPWAILHVPHASTVIPPEIRSQFVLSDAELEAEIGRMTDHATDALYGFGWPGEQVVKAAVSRLVVDVERFEDDAGEPMAIRGMGVIYTCTSNGQPLRRPLRPDEREALLARGYRPHHRRLAAMVGAAIDRHGMALIVDAHSYPRRALPYEDPALDRPDIGIGIDRVHTPEPLVDALAGAFVAQGFRVGIDTPFAGALVPAPFHRVDPRWRSVMIEVRRDLYADDDGRCRPQAFETMQAAIRSSLAAAYRQGLR